jgi:hypothetical protein
VYTVSGMPFCNVVLSTIVFTVVGSANLPHWPRCARNGGDDAKLACSPSI